MTLRDPRGVHPALLLLFLLPLWPCGAEVIMLSAPYPALCITSPGALYSVDQGALHPKEGLFAVAPLGEKPLDPLVIAPSEGQPGQLLRFYISSGEPLDSVALTIKGPDQRTLSSGTGFRTLHRVEDADSVRSVEDADSQAATGEHWAVLLGIPAVARAKAYSLTVRVSCGVRSYVLAKAFVVKPRTFLTERFSLTQDLAALVTVPDPKKTVESRTLARILTTPHSDAFYETEALSVPLPLARRTSGYGDERQMVYPDSTSSLSVHWGVDMASPVGTAVPACGSGKVVFAALRILTGNSIVIEHLPGLFSLYYHLASIKVAVGDVVTKGQIIGEVGMTGLATGPHLHWEVQALGIPVDPDALTHDPLLDTHPHFDEH
jgi:hypothetical protein